MDEASARSLLTQMQARLSRDPYEALGVGTASGPGEVRTAFLGLTKQFHPAKFARMATDVQKLSNEVFLALRSAHDTLSRPSTTSKATGSVPTVRAALGRPSSPPASVNATPALTPSRVPTQPIPVSRTQSVPTSGGTGPRPAITTPITRPAITPVANGTPRPGHAPSTTPSGTGPRPIQPARSPGSTPPATATTPATPGHSAVRSTNPPATAPATSAPPSAADREVAPILALLELGQFAAAKVALASLSARNPMSNRYKALVHYAKAREAQAANRPEDARGELLDALQIEPGFELANTALATLFSKRK